MGAASWSNAGYITASDGNYASATLVVSGESTYYLKAMSFGFSIPSSATIKGILVQAYGYSFYGHSVIDSSIRLVKGGTIGGNNNARSSTTYWPSSGVSMQSWGSSTDLWGLSWSAADINQNNFGAVISLQSVSSNTNHPYIDYVQITVYYAP